MFTVIQHQQTLLTSQVVDHLGEWGRRGGRGEAQRLEQGLRHQMRFGQRREVDPPGALFKGVGQFPSNGNGKPSFTATASASQRDQPVIGQQPADLV